MMSQLIPTKIRFKIGAPWSYPIGAEAISAALSHTPVFDALTLSFHERKGTPDRLEQCYRVLSIDYRTAFPASKYAEQLGFDVPRWSICVYAVPRREKAAIHALLVEQGLPNAATWLSFQRPDTWYDSRHVLTLSFDQESQSLRVEEDGSAWH